MSVATTAARDVTRTISSGRRKDRSTGSMVFLGLLWFSLFFGVMVLLVLIVSTAIDGASRFDSDLLTNYDSVVHPETTGFRAGILGSLWLMAFTALLAVPLGIAAALYLEEFADKDRWYNRFIELNLQNLAAVPSIVYGLLAVAVMALMGFRQTGIVLGGSVALALLILPVIIITTREAVRAVPDEIRQGSLALGATVWQTTWRQTLPSAIPGIATGTILGLLRDRRGSAARGRRAGRVPAVRPDRNAQPGHRTAHADLFTDLTVPGGVPARRLRGDHRAAGADPGTQRSRHLHPQQVPANLVRSHHMPTHPATASTRIADGGEMATMSAATKDASREVPMIPPEAVMEAFGLNVFYGDFHAVHDVNLTFGKNEITAPSARPGGKSTVLRCLNRMNDLVSGARVEGNVNYHGQNIYARNVDPIAVRTQIGMVFQKPNPFPKSIYDNIAYGPRVTGMKVDNMDDLVEESLRGAALWDEVKDKLKQSAYGLSGGQQQRLCIARTIATKPDVILMDEPCPPSTRSRPPASRT